MTREDIIRIAREVGIVFADHTVVGSEDNLLQDFANLVAAAEREACAQILDRNAEVCCSNAMLRDVLIGNALAIRARGGNE